MRPDLDRLLDESLETQAALRAQLPLVAQLGARLVKTLKQGGKLLTCGNGGSAADAQHMSEELLGRFKSDRIPLPAVALTADSQLLTCIANDYGYDEVFARQVVGLGRPGDMLVCFSTSGNSPTLIRAIHAARRRKVFSVALLGKGGGKTRGLADLEIIVPGDSTARIQEAHTFILHAVLEIVENHFKR